MSLTEIKEQIRQMTAQERGDIQTFLENLRSGKTKGIPLEEVLKELREHLPSDAEDDLQTRERR